MSIQRYENREFELQLIPDGDTFRVLAPGIARALGIRDSFRLMESIPEAEKGYTLACTPGGEQRVGYLTEPGFYRAIGQRQAARVKDPLIRAQVERFQGWVYSEVLPAIRRDGGYVDPYADEHQLKALMFQCRSQMELAQAAKGLIHPDHLEAKARIILARGMGEAPELDPQTRPLYTQAFLKEKGLSKKQLQAKGGVFGKRMKRAYIDAHGREPQKYPLELSNGQVREVNGYTEADRPLMQQVWRDYFEEVRA